MSNYNIVLNLLDGAPACTHSHLSSRYRLQRNGGVGGEGFAYTNTAVVPVCVSSADEHHVGGQRLKPRYCDSRCLRLY